MSYKTADFFCEDCGFTDIIMFKRSEGPEEYTCECGSQLIMGFPSPKILRASLADGQSRGNRWKYSKESAKLEQEASRQRKNGNRETAFEMKTEAKELAKKASKARDITDT